MNGQLSELPLAELVCEILQKRISGTLRLQHESVRTIVYFEDGQIIYAVSNLRNLRIGEYLKKQGLITEAQLSELGKRPDLALVAELSTKGIVNREAMEPLIARQVSDVLRVAVLWTSGTWEFDDRSRLGDPTRVKIDMPALLIEAARKMKLDFVRSRFPPSDETISRAASPPDFVNLTPSEGFVLSRLDHATPLRDLIAVSGLRELDAARTIYGLILGGFLERERPYSVLPASSTKPTAATSEEPSSIAESEDQKLDLDAFLARVESAETHYEVLSVNETSPADQIKTGYYTMARNYHPDRFHLKAGTPLHARIETAFARITQAYEILTDSNRRSAYDAKLAAQLKAQQLAQSAPKRDKDSAQSRVRNDEIGILDQSDVERAEKSFTEGFAALDQGHIKLAITHLAAAARLAPQDARYRAYYGRALAGEEGSRRLAEAELQAALKLDATNASYRVMLADLYFDLGLYRRAEGELDRAFAIEPNNAQGRKLALKLETARTTK
ncbi:MAG TPA: DUF4388 domain-containing protein [Pyrinomonadaceae bacterium]|nr:DUF4388 domain-containing protein [Pyrinomonadaceae bacterium]